MKNSLILTTVAFGALASLATAQQQYPRRANITGGGGPDRGKCTIEVVVDGAAEVDIRGDNGVLRNLNGQPPQWRRFECTGPMPSNPVNFRFSGVDGRGRQELVRDPRNGGGAATVRIQDPQGGQEGYTFDVTWGGGGGPEYSSRQEFPGGQADPRYAQPVDPRNAQPADRRYEGDRRYERGQVDSRDGRRFTADEAIRVCEDNIRQIAADRFGARSVVLRNTRIDDNPGRNDWVTGWVDVRKPFGRQTYHFTCSVNFDNGRVRSAQIDQFEDQYYNRPRGGD